MANLRPLDGYPDSFGSHRACVFPHAGPTSYTRVTVTPGTVPMTGGDLVQAGEAGLKYFDVVFGGHSDDGAFSVIAVPVTPTAIVGGPSQTYRLKWIAQVAGTIGGQAQTAGSEAAASTNLSTVTVRLFALGPKS